MTLIEILTYGLYTYVGLVVVLAAVILFMDWTERWGIMLCPSDCDDDCQNCDRFPDTFKVQAD